MLDAPPPDIIYKVASPFGLEREAVAVAHLNMRVTAGADIADAGPLVAETLHRYRAHLQACTPALAAFAHHLRDLLWEGVQVIVIDSLGLNGLELSARRHFLYALAALLGRPSPTDPARQRVLWDVKSRPVQDDYYPTFSEHDREAAMHSDTQYYLLPERYLLLYAVHAARCGGGLNTFARGQDLLEHLAATPAGAEAIRVLSQTALPFRIPSVFSTSPEPQFTWAPVLAQAPRLRYRRDTLIDGLHHFPECHSPAVDDALTLFEQALDAVTTPPLKLPDDGLVLLNNHESLHARTAFQDHERHLIRARMLG